MQKSRYRRPSGRPHRRTVAPRVREQHSRSCALSSGRGRRCSCRPSFVASVRRGRQAYERSFPTLSEAVAFAEATYDALRRGAVPATPHEEAPLLRDLAISFLHRARAGEALGRSRRPYTGTTIDGYEVALRLRVLPHADSRTGLSLGDLSAGSLMNCFRGSFCRRRRRREPLP